MVYNKKNLVVLIVLCTSMANLVSMDTHQPMLVELERIYKTMADSDVAPSDSAQKLAIQLSRIDVVIDQLEGHDKQRLLTQAQHIQDTYKAVLRRVLKSQVTAAHAINKKRVYALMSNIVYAALTSASIPLVHQGLQIGTGNLNALDNNVLLGAALEGVLIELVRQGFGPYHARIGNMAAEVTRGELIPFTAGAIASLTNVSMTVSAPTKWGVLMAGIRYEILFIVMDMIEQEGGIVGIIKNVNVPRLMIGIPAISSQEQRIVHYAQPQVDRILSHPKIQRALMQTMVVACDSIMVGIIMHQYLNLGFADEKGMYQTIEGAAIRGLAEGLVSYLVNRTSGASFTIGSGMLARASQNMLLKGAGLSLSMTDATTVLLHKGVQTAAYYAIDEAGGIGNLVKTLVSKASHTVQHSWWRPFRQSVIDAVGVAVNYAIARPLFY